MTENQFDPEPIENEPVDQAVPEQVISEEQAVAEPTIEVPPAAPPPVAVAEAADDGEKKNQTITILAVALAAVVACLCTVVFFTTGLGIFGGGEKATSTPTPAPPPIVETVTPLPTSTTIPTPEPGEPPAAVIDVSTTRAFVGQDIQFDGGNSAGSTPLTGYVWDFADGNSVNASTATYAYSAPGSYRVTLTVTDSEGQSNSARVQIQIDEPEPTAEAPYAVIKAPGAAKVGDVVTFDARESTSGNPIVNYTWNFGDRTQGNGAVVDKVYEAPATYDVSVTITDNTGQTASAVVQIVIEGIPQAPPSAVIDAPAQAVVDEDVQFSAENSVPGSSPIVYYIWNFGDGDGAEGRREVAPSHRYSTPGRYQVDLIVEDENGLSATTSTAVVVNAALEGTTWQLTPVLSETEITADFNNGNLSGFSGCNTYNGNYTATDAGAMTVSALSTTQQLCQDDISAQEARYLSALQAATSFTVSGENLALTYPGGTLTFVVQP